MAETEPTVYELAGGMPFFEALVDRFYEGVETDPMLRPMYPDDLSGPRWRLAHFLAQYWGGPPMYSEQRGHPRLRMRHAPFAIDERARDAWLVHMRTAISRMDPPEPVASALLEYVGFAAESMRNR
jgi:hemoglobin